MSRCKLAVAAYYSAIANGGILPGVWWVDGGEERADGAESSTGRRIFSEETAEFLKNALTVGMEEWYSSPLIYDSFGKTGTAEVDGANPHAWFVCSLEQEDIPPYTVAVFLKNGGNSISARTAAAELLNRPLFASSMQKGVVDNR